MYNQGRFYSNDEIKHMYTMGDDSIREYLQKAPRRAREYVEKIVTHDGEIIELMEEGRQDEKTV